MAADIPKKKLWDETTCSLCLDFFTDPVMLECGHNFCKGCIFWFWGKPLIQTLFCPLCKKIGQQTTLWPNKQLENLVDIARQLVDKATQEAVVWGVCVRHQEPLSFFCKDDEVPLCTVCRRFKRHQQHRVVLLENAAQEYRGQIGICLENLRKKEEELLVSKENTEEQSQELACVLEKESQRTGAAFRLLRQFLEEEEKLHLTLLEEVNEEVAKKKEEGIARLSKELSSLETTIWELEEKRKKPLNDLMKDIKGILQRGKQKEKLETPVVYPPALKWRIWEFLDIGPILEKLMKDFRGLLKSECQLHKENITMDPVTVHPDLLLSEDGKGLMFSEIQESPPPSTVGLVYCRGALGSKWFQSGRHCWEVDVGKEEGWMVGICILPLHYENINSPVTEGQILGIGKWDGHYRVLFYPHHPPVPVREKLKKIRVLLNYLGHLVAFFDADTAACLCTCSIPLFPPFRYYPYFGLWAKSSLRLDP